MFYTGSKLIYGYFSLFPKALVAFSKLYYDEIVYIKTMDLKYNDILIHLSYLYSFKSVSFELFPSLFKSEGHSQLKYR